MEVQELPTKIVDSAFELVRLPVTVVADHLGPLAPQDVECWAPRLGVDALEGVVKETVGTLLRDEHMRASGRATREAVDRRRAARRAEATADEVEAQADDEMAARLEATDAARAAAQQRAANRKRSASQQAAAKTQSVRARAAQRESAVEQAAAQRDATIEREARAQRLAALDAEADALASEQAARAAEQRAEAADAAISRSKARRSSDG